MYAMAVCYYKEKAALTQFFSILLSNNNKFIFSKISKSLCKKSAVVIV